MLKFITNLTTFIITLVYLGSASPLLAQDDLDAQKGPKIPPMGFGTWVDPQHYQPQAIEEPLREALEAGYRHIDTALTYGNHRSVGKVVEQFLKKNNSVKREDLWITSKVPTVPSDRARLQQTVDQALVDLQAPYINLLLIHMPPQDYDDQAVLKGWTLMNELVEQGKVKQIGVSNFYQNQLSRLIKLSQEHDLLPPAVNQVEVNPMAPEEELVDFCQKNNIHVTAYSPLAGLGSGFLLQNEELTALAGNLEVSPASLILASSMKRGLSVIPKSLRVERIKENLKSTERVDLITEEVHAKITSCFGANFPVTQCAQDAKDWDRILAELEKEK